MMPDMAIISGEIGGLVRRLAITALQPNSRQVSQLPRAFRIVVPNQGDQGRIVLYQT
jgi:hypothetical protein